MGAGVGLADGRRAAALRPDDGGLRRLPHPHRRAGRPRARLHRPSSASSTTRSSCVMSDNGAVGRGRREGLVQRAVLLQLRAREPRGEPAPHRRPRHAAGQQPLPLGLGVGRATRRSSGSSATRTRAASPTRSSCTGPRGLGTDGETRHQYVHAIDVMPTLLDLIGIEPPDVIAGVEQTPDRGRELRADAARRRRAERARHPVLRDARLAGALPRRMEGGGVPPAAVHRLRRQRRDASRSTTTCGSCTTSPRTSPRCTTSPPSEPEKLAEMQALWWEEAERYQVLPLNNQPGPLRRPALPARPLRVPRRDRPAARGDRAEPPEPLVRHRRRARRPRATVRPTA